MNKHTPGPWTVTRVSKSTILKDLYVSASPERVARVVLPATANSIDEYEANARLIAAAPDLLEALKGFMDGAEAMGWNTDKARAAIAKATGEQT